MSIATIIKQFKNATLKKSVKQVQRETAMSLAQTIRLLDKDIERLNTEIQDAKSNTNINNLPLIVEQLIFFRVAFKDVLTGSKQLLIADNESDRNFIARTLALHIYEVLDDSKEFFNRKMKDEVKQLPNKDLLLADFFFIQELFKGFKNNAFEELKDIRHNTVAHKELNSVVLSQKITNIDVERVSAFSILALVLFVCVLAFQKNVNEMVMQNTGGTLDGTYGPKKWDKVESCFKCQLWQIKGMKPWLAEMLCEKTNKDLYLYKAVINALGNAAKARGDEKSIKAVDNIKTQLELI